MRAWRRFALPALAGLACWMAAVAATAQPPTIVASWDARGESCNAEIPLLTADTLYVLAVPGEMAHIDGAEFRVTGFPMEWFGITIIPSPASIIALGNPLTTGCKIAFPDHQFGTDGVVLLYTVAFFSTSAISERVIGFAAHAIAPFEPCPLLLADYGVAFWAACATPSPAAINYSSFCTVGVERTSWARVRELYR